MVLVSCSGSNGADTATQNSTTTGGSRANDTSTHVGGNSTVASGPAETGGTTVSDPTNTGGHAVTGGAMGTGGFKATGGLAASGGTASSSTLPASGGTSAAGGMASLGGAIATGGLAATGGSETTGGSAAMGGKAATGGMSGTGGAANAGGSLARGGTSATGGVVSTGGSIAVGGATTGGTNALGCTGNDTTYKLVWSDEFNSAAGTALDASKWTYDVGGNGWGNSELEYYTNGNANAAMDGNGNLAITVKKESMSGMSYTSSRVKTLGLESWIYGRVEARIKIPKGQGMWPAFWLLGTDINTNSWPACGEIDVMENVGKEPNVVHGSMHGPGYSGGTGPTAQTSLSSPVGDAFHVFAIEWEQNVNRWYVDNTLYSTKTPNDIPTGATWVYAHSFFILLNVAVGGTWPGSPDSTTVFPQQMLVDYVRVCQH